jgi:hypothetical protein
MPVIESDSKSQLYKLFTRAGFSTEAGNNYFVLLVDLDFMLLPLVASVNGINLLTSHLQVAVKNRKNVLIVPGKIIALRIVQFD